MAEYCPFCNLETGRNQRKIKVKQLEKALANMQAIAEFQQSINMDRYFEIKKLKTRLTACINVNKGLISRNKFLEEDRDKYQNMVFDKMERIDRAKKIIGNLYAICKDNHYPNSSVLMEQAEQFLKEEE
jgi:hypothetical protein